MAEGEHGLAPIQCYCSLCLAILLLLSTTAMPRSASCLSDPETGIPTPLLLKKKKKRGYSLETLSADEDFTARRAKHRGGKGAYSRMSSNSGEVITN